VLRIAITLALFLTAAAFIILAGYELATPAGHLAVAGSAAFLLWDIEYRRR
jgi:hypothetical protein